MEAEEWRGKKEQILLEAYGGEAIQITGILGEIKEVDHGLRLKMSCVTVKREGESDEDGGKIRNLYVYADDAEGLGLGRVFLVSGTCKKLDGPRNPGEYDYRSYCLANGIGGIVNGAGIYDP